MQWFEVGVKYSKLNNQGKNEKITEVYLVDAISWTDSEVRTVKEIEQFVNSDFVIDKMKKSKIKEIFPFDIGDYWFKGVVEFISIDESKGKEKKTSFNCLLNADNITEALSRLEKSYSEMTIDFDITSISKSNIIEIFPYFEQKNESEADN